VACLFVDGLGTPGPLTGTDVAALWIMPDVPDVPDLAGRRRVEAVTFASVVCRLLRQFDEAKVLLASEPARGREDGRAAAHALVELMAV
jgi:hypothetical protein